MTKSQGFSAHRRAFIKSVRAKSHSEGTSFRKTLENVSNTNDAKKALITVDTLNPCEPRNIRREWYSDALIIDDGDYYDLKEDDIYDYKVDFSDADVYKRQTNMTTSLLEIARPARKQKGIAKDFEVIKKPLNTLLDGEEFEIWEQEEFDVWEDDWDDIYDEINVDKRRTYSSVLRGNET